MSKFYRIQTCAGGQRLVMVREESRFGKDAFLKRSLDTKRYLDNLEEISAKNSVKILLPPLLQEEYIARNIFVKIKSGVEFPDVWGLAATGNAVVSEKLKKIIEDIDGDIHQFHACKIFDQKGQQITSSNYYFLHVRRIVKVEGFSPSVSRLPNFNIPLQEREYFTAIQESEEARSAVCELNLWGVHKSYFAFHVSEEVFEIFKANEITGLKNYSKPDGVAGEGVVAYG